MARVPISFYLNILAGIIVLFNHYVASETGDVALNKITGAAGRFYTLFRDTALTFQHGCASRLETVLCGTPLDSLLPRDTIANLRVHYCHSPAQGLESVDGTSSDRRQHGGYYGGSDFAGSRAIAVQPMPVNPQSSFSSRDAPSHVCVAMVVPCAGHDDGYSPRHVVDPGPCVRSGHCDAMCLTGPCNHYE
ncbi:hypothetical protein L210DRAFT_3551745 [Boletus edulis BED1]|uniref:Uncharacterized protein n=1 Tax=Boletus edulis BED1 TaxID=1328754 RepID=A0AAD4GBS3_BOLED|nr:hypothetical protein L210DRAFT_3551745 [Boletus edulis BED1]